jgi:hypothetical protein
MDRLLRTVAICAALCCFPTAANAQPAAESREAVLVQGSSLGAAIAAVCAVGGEITHELRIINAVGARLTSKQLTELEAHDDSLRIRADRMTKVDSQQIADSGTQAPERQELEGPCALAEAGTPDKTDVPR